MSNDKGIRITDAVLSLENCKIEWANTTLYARVVRLYPGTDNGRMVKLPSGLRGIVRCDVGERLYIEYFDDPNEHVTLKRSLVEFL